MDREKLKVDVLFVGAGPASLSAALHLSYLVQKHDQEIHEGVRQGSPLGQLTLLVIEKGKEIGSHALSGAVCGSKSFSRSSPELARW